MSEHFIKYIDIESYKCFQNFKAEDFKRVNLISGKNNIGKTAFLEAGILNVSSYNAASLLATLVKISFVREKLNHVGQEFDYEKFLAKLIAKNDLLNESTNINTVSLHGSVDGLSKNYEMITNKGGSENISSKKISWDVILENQPPNNVSFVSSHGLSPGTIKKYFSNVQIKDCEVELYSFINKFDSNVVNMKIMGGEYIQCKVMDADGSYIYRDIHELGEGLIHYISIIVALYACENGYLFIDEIDNGIHYSILDRLWNIILTLSNEMNVQVFATTHSLGCIESYCRVAEKLNDQDISFTTLVKNKEKQVKAIVYDYEVFTNSTHQGHEVRGW
jgi:AAA15 family ATPase/GTPase